jgi:hypothetical protein
LPPRPNVRRTDLAKIVPKEASPLPEDTRHWSATDVLRWLIQDDLEDFKDVFYANGFEGPMLLTLSASSFKAGGFDAARCDILQISLNKLQNTTKPIYQARVLYTYDAKKKSQLSVEEGSIVRCAPFIQSPRPCPGCFRPPWFCSPLSTYTRLGIPQIDVLDDATLWWKAQDPITKAQGQVRLALVNYSCCAGRVRVGVCVQWGAGQSTHMAVNMCRCRRTIVKKLRRIAHRPPKTSTHSREPIPPPPLPPPPPPPPPPSSSLSRRR